MPTELYGTLYGHNNLPLLCTMLKDIYAKKPQAPTAASTAVTPGATAPFTLLRTHLGSLVSPQKNPLWKKSLTTLLKPLPNGP